MSRCLKYLSIIHIFFVVVSFDALGVDEYFIKWGVHNSDYSGTTAPTHFQRSPFGDTVSTPAWSSAPNDQEISELDADGTNSSFIDSGDIIELGFFDTDNTNSHTPDATDQSALYSPNTSSSTLFRGIWTPITEQSTVGNDYGGDSIGDGLFWFSSTFQNDSSNAVNDGSLGSEDRVIINENSGAIITDELDGNTGIDSATTMNTAWDIGKALDTLVDAGSTPYIGIRFYDQTSKVNGTTRYNTIMNQNWTFSDGELIFLQEGASGGATSGLEFEFANSSYSSTLIGKGGSNAVGSSDYVATIAYYNGDDMDITNSGVGDVILSGMHKDSSGGIITVGDDNTLTINSTSGNTFDFSGDIQGASGAGASTIVKTGAGEQILTGDVNLAGSSSGWADILEGTLTFNPDSGHTQSVEYVKNSSGTPTLELDNTGIGTGQIVELGFANTTSAQTFSGGVTLSGSNGTSNKIKIASGATDYSKEQIFSGAITGTNTLVKDGAGRLVLTGDSTTTFSGNITVDDGTLVIGNGSSDGSNLDNDNTITINKGKLEIADNETVTLTAQGGSGKSMIGGKGTISTVTIGDASGEVDYISPGRGISSSLTPSKKGVDFDASTDSIGALTVTTLNWNSGGVFDWQIKDFDPAGGTAGTDWDKLNFTTLNFESGQTFDINILAVQNDGTAGNVSNNSNTWNTYATNNGFLFLQGTTVNNLSDGDVTSSFNIRSNDFNYQIGHYYGDWGVYKDGGNFYLTYSAVPEPSTYIMVTGLFLLPGWRWIRRLRATAKGDDKSEV